MKTCKKMLSLVLSLLIVFASAAVGGTGILSYAADGSVPTDAVTVQVTNSELEVTAKYKETGYFYFEAENMPDGAAVHVFVNDEDRGEATYIYVNDPTEDYTVEAKVLDANGNTLAASGQIKVTVKNGFFDRVAAFLKETAGTFFDAVADIVSAIFMRIWVFLHR